MDLPRFAPSRSARLRNASREEGSALVATTIVIAAAMALAAVLVTSYLTSEAEQVEDSLTQARAYWAMAGHLQYLRSRTENGGLCGASGKDTYANNKSGTCALGDDDGSVSTSVVAPFVSVSGRTSDSRAGSLQEYLDPEAGKSVSGIQNGSVLNPGFRVWYYPQQMFSGADGFNPLNFSVRGFVNPHKPNEGKGQMRLDLDISANGSAPAVRNLATRFGRLTFGFCVVDQNGVAADLVTPKTDNLTSNCRYSVGVEGQSRIQFIKRDHPLCYATSSGC